MRSVFSSTTSFDGGGVKAQRFFYGSLGLALTLLLVQFFLFRIPAVFELSLKTHLYDHVWWVERPASHLVLGSSNAMNAVIPALVAEQVGLAEGEVLNLGTNGGTPFVMHRNLELYLQRFPSPKTIDVVITPVMLVEYHHVHKEYEKIWLNWEQWRALEKEGIVNSYAFPAMLFWQSLNFDPMKDFRDYHWSLADTRRNRGFQPIYEQKYSFELRPNDFPRRFGPFGWSEHQLDHLERIFRRGRELGAEVRAVLTPIHPLLYEVYVERAEELKGLEREIRRRLGKVKRIGSMNPGDYAMEHQHFINSDHVGIGGARRFSRGAYGIGGEPVDFYFLHP